MKSFIFCLISCFLVSFVLNASPTYFVSNNHSSITLPKILSESDIEIYKKILSLQEKSLYDEADLQIEELNNQILVPYYLYLRYKTSSYNPTIQELIDWLENYNTTAVSSEMYSIINKKIKKSNLKITLKKPNSFYDRFIPIYLRHEVFSNQIENIDFSKEYKPSLLQNSTTKKLNFYLKKGKTLNVKNILLSNKVKKYLDAKTYDYYASKLGRSYFLDGDDIQAIYWNKVATLHNPALYSDSMFSLGLSYYRLKNFKESARFFKFFYANAKYLSSENIAKGSYWYARVCLQLKDMDNYYKSLKLASKYKYNFYGILALKELGIDVKYDSSVDYVEYYENDMKNLSQTRYGERALALLQMGFNDWAEQELIYLANYEVSSFNTKLEISILNALIYLSSTHYMPALSLKIAGEMGMYYGFAHLSYPIFIINLRDGYEVDPSLLLAISRRESNFYAGAQSSVGAQGLMQLLPNTANLMIKKYNFDSQMTNYLNTKPVSVELGQKYLNFLIQNENSKGNLIYVIAGYNGGFRKVIKWINEPHRMPNNALFFIESVPYYETRNYIKSVLTDYWIYQTKLGLQTHSLSSIVQNGQPIYYHPSKKEIKRIKENYAKEALQN